MSSQLCPHCGTPNRAGSNFCNRCGADLRGEATPGDASTTAHPEPLPPDAPGASSTAVAVSNAGSSSGAQPWLEAGFTGADDAPFEEDDDDLAALDELPPVSLPAMRLVSGVQGLLEPIRVAAIPHAAPTAPGVGHELPFSNDQVRRVRALMLEEPLLTSIASAPRSRRTLWLPWIFLALGLGVAAPLIFGWSAPTGVPARWSGVDRGYRAVEALGAGARVQVLWAYDPATAGEMDLLAAPVLSHLLEREAVLNVVSLLPNGPATARRLFAEVAAERLPDLAALGVRRPFEVRFLPGGATVLPLLAAHDADLAIVIGAQAEDVQQWLELVAPVNRAPVLAITAAGADPPLRPYLESGQLVGLVSGFDGGFHYAELVGAPPTPDAVRGWRFQVAGQNAGALALLAIIVLGNLAALLTGRRQDG